MKLDAINYEVGDIKVSPCKTTINGELVKNTKAIKIFSKNKECSFCFYTIKPVSYFNTLPLNQKVDVMDKIDSYDICLDINGNFFINSSLNSEVYFTKLDDLIFKLSVIINNLDDVVVSKEEANFSRFELEIIIDLS